MIETPTFGDILDAARRVEGHVVRTPILRLAPVDAAVGAEVWMKCETLQHAGAFKFRGATNAVLSLDDQQARAGVAAHSSGNHAAALALAACRRGIAATLVMPHDAPQVKVDAVRRAGGSVVFCEPTLSARAAALEEVLTETGAVEIHPYDDPRVIAGAGTAALELIDDVPDLDLVVAPVSGGGLLSGTSLAVHGRRPETNVWGAEPDQVDDAHRSLVAGQRLASAERVSIADGLLATLSDRTFDILSAHVTDIVLVTEDEIRNAMAVLVEGAKLLVEPSAAVALAGLISRRGGLPDRVGLILSGANVDIDRLSEFCGAAR